jgi:hypothetical protein
VGLSPSPFATSPLVLKSMCQLSVSPALFFNVKANTALPCLIASFRSASEEVRAALMSSKACDEGKASARASAFVNGQHICTGPTVLERHLVLWFICCLDVGTRFETTIC